MARPMPRHNSGGCLSKEAVLSTHNDFWAVKMPTCSSEPREEQRKVDDGEEEEVG